MSVAPPTTAEAVEAIDQARAVELFGSPGFTTAMKVSRGEEFGVALTSPWLPSAAATTLFRYLYHHGPFAQHSNVFMGKVVQQPRRGFNVGEPYFYTGKMHSESDNAPDDPSSGRLPFAEVKSVVQHLQKALEPVVGHPLNNALIQLYRDGDDCIYPHSDDESVMRSDVVERLGATAPWEKQAVGVAILSLGAPREMEFTAAIAAHWAREVPLTVHVPAPSNTSLMADGNLGRPQTTLVSTHSAEGTALGAASRRITTAELTPGHLTVFMGEQSVTQHAIHRLTNKKKAARPDMDQPRISISMRWFYTASDPRPAVVPKKQKPPRPEVTVTPIARGNANGSSVQSAVVVNDNTPPKRERPGSGRGGAGASPFVAMLRGRSAPAEAPTPRQSKQAVAHHRVEDDEVVVIDDDSKTGSVEVISDDDTDQLPKSATRREQ